MCERLITPGAKQVLDLVIRCMKRIEDENGTARNGGTPCELSYVDLRELLEKERAQLPA